MSLRVDLLVEGERRYQGAVSRPFVVKSIAGFVLAALVLWGGLTTQRALSVRRELRLLDADWVRVESRVKSVDQKRAMLSKCQGFKKELDAWANTRILWSDRLQELQGLVPASTQLNRLQIKSEWKFIAVPLPPAPPPKEGETAKPRVAKPPPPIPARSYLLAISGRAAGDAGADAVRDLPNQLRSVPGFRDLFESIKLQRMVRASGGGPAGTESADRTFDIDCQSVVRKLE